MAKLVAPNFDEKNQRLLNEIMKLKISKEGLIETLYKHLPAITPHVNPENRLVSPAAIAVGPAGAVETVACFSRNFCLSY